MAERTVEELRMLQALPLEIKIAKTKVRIDEWVKQFGQDGCYISFSGGKDSTVLKHIINQMYPKIPSVFVDTGLEYPEIREFVKTHDDVTWLKPDKNFKKVVLEYGYPMFSKRVSHNVRIAKRNPNGKIMKNVFDANKKGPYAMHKWLWLIDAPFDVAANCCDIMKKAPAKHYEKSTGRLAIIATMASESVQRETIWLKDGCNSFKNDRPQSKPISFWTEQDVLQYIKRYNVPYASIYGDIIETDGKLQTTGEKRTGCMFCGFGAHLEKYPNRFESMRHTHPKQWEFCMKPVEQGGLGMESVLDYCGIPTGRDEPYWITDFNYEGNDTK